MIVRGREEEREVRSDRYKNYLSTPFSVELLNAKMQPLVKVVGESSGSEPLVKKSKSSSSMSKSNDANKSNEASNKTLAKITIEHCNS